MIQLTRDERNYLQGLLRDHKGVLERRLQACSRHPRVSKEGEQIAREIHNVQKLAEKVKAL